MRESAPQFVTPMSMPQPRGARLLTAFSPKLGRTVRAFDHAAFDQWIRLEADPAVNVFCEHPRRVGSDDEGAMIDFWVAGRSNEEMLVLERGQVAATLRSSVKDIPLRLVPAAERAAAAVWVSNWQRLIPVINATRGLAPKTLVKSVLSLVHKPLALSLIDGRHQCAWPGCEGQRAPALRPE